MAARCGKGKPCGASCVQRSKHCAVELKPALAKGLDQARQKIGVVALFEQGKQHGAPGFRAKFEKVRKGLAEEIGGQIRKPEHVQELKKRLQEEGLLPLSRKAAQASVQKPSPKPSKKSDEESPEEEWEDLTAKAYDGKLEGKKLTREGDKDFKNWIDKGTYEAGGGSFATVSANLDGNFVKRGILSETEASILKKVGERDLGPKLVAADLDGKVKVFDEEGNPDLELGPIAHLGLRHGRLAMTRVPGKDLEATLEESGSLALPESKINGKPAADVYWKAMADLHRLGVAHNDAHPGNLFIDDRSGKGRWVDFGMAQENPKAALAEGLGAFAHPSVYWGRDFQKYLAPDSSAAIDWSTHGGNWQTRAWNVTGMDRVDEIMGKPAAKRLEADLPVVARIRSNRKEVDRLLEEKYGLNPGEIAAIYAHGIRSPLNSYEQGPWQKLSDKDAQDLVEVLYEGV